MPHGFCSRSVCAMTAIYIPQVRDSIGIPGSSCSPPPPLQLSIMTHGILFLPVYLRQKRGKLRLSEFRLQLSQSDPSANQFAPLGTLGPRGGTKIARDVNFKHMIAVQQQQKIAQRGGQATVQTHTYYCALKPAEFEVLPSWCLTGQLEPE
ncbi:hypothetical protein BDW68DRAFT_131761 [Aspergillus falconensis]